MEIFPDDCIYVVLGKDINTPWSPKVKTSTDCESHFFKKKKKTNPDMFTQDQNTMRRTLKRRRLGSNGFFLFSLFKNEQEGPSGVVYTVSGADAGCRPAPGCTFPLRLFLRAVVAAAALFFHTAVWYARPYTCGGHAAWLAGRLAFLLYSVIMALLQGPLERWVTHRHILAGRSHPVCRCNTQITWAFSLASKFQQ